jgi:AraC-like DNA-binding protein
MENLLLWDCAVMLCECFEKALARWNDLERAVHEAEMLLRKKEGGVAEVAERVGYGSASAFSVAFTRHVGLPPSRFAHEMVPNRP